MSCFHQLDISFLSSCYAASPCRYSQLSIALKPPEGWEQLKRARGIFLYRNRLYSPVRGGAKVSHFNVTILKSGPSPFNLPRFQSRPALILLISTSGLIRMETVFHPEMGPVLQPQWGWERLNDGGRWKPSADRRPLSSWLVSVSPSGEADGAGCCCDLYFLLCEGYLRCLAFHHGLFIALYLIWCSLMFLQ